MGRLTKAQRTRLDKLATYLEGLPEDYAHFRMWMWITGASEEGQIRYARRNGGVASCGTAACAAGHGPAAGVLVPPRFICSGTVWWRQYALEMFVGGDVHKEIWVFGGTWDGVDGGHYAAAARIRYLLDNGEPPEGMGSFADSQFIPLYAPYRVDAKALA